MSLEVHYYSVVARQTFHCRSEHTEQLGFLMPDGPGVRQQLPASRVSFYGGESLVVATSCSPGQMPVHGICASVPEESISGSSEGRACLSKISSSIRTVGPPSRGDLHRWHDVRPPCVVGCLSLVRGTVNSVCRCQCERRTGTESQDTRRQGDL